MCVGSLESPYPESGFDAAVVADTLTKEYDLTDGSNNAKYFTQTASAISRRCNYPVICGIKTKTGDLRHVSVFTFAGGRLADIADRTISLCNGYTDGDTIKVLRLRNADVGILVDTDVLFAKNWKKTAPVCNCIISIAECGSETDFAFVPTLASLFGKPYLIAFSCGDLMWGNPK